MADGRSGAAPMLTEQELSATSLALIAQPALWVSMRLPAAASRAPAHEEPWTTYWATRLDAAMDVEQARALYEAACAAFGARGDRVGELLCIAAIIEGFYVDEGPLDPLDHWIGALCRCLPADGQWPSIELEARVIGCGVGILLRNPSHPLLQLWALRGASLVRQVKPGAGRLKLATFLAQYHLWRGEFGRTALIVDALPGLDMSGLLPGEALIWLETVANHARCAAQYDRGREAVDQALAILHRHGMRQHAYALHAHGASIALAAQDPDTAQRHIDAMRPVLDGGPQADQTHYWHFQAGLALLRGETARAVELARAAQDNSAEIGGPYRSAVHSMSLGQALLRAGETANALERFDASLAEARRIEATLLAFTALLMRGACLLRLGHSVDALQALREAWAEGAKRDFRSTSVWWLPEVIAEVAQAALAHDIEPAYVRRFVRRRALPGPDPALVDWPWPLVLRAFGEFEALLDDAPVARLGAKTARRPLDLLRALLANGTGPLPAGTAMQWLWPDADAAAQRKSFDVALLRLRRMLGDPRLVRLEGGRLWLDAHWVWSDVAALHALMHRIGSGHGASLEQLQEWARQLLVLMRGPFLDGEDADWVLGARERYRQRFVVAVAQLAGHLEPPDAQAAIRLYERALDVEPLAESLSRRLMKLLADRGDRAEALRVWRACCTMHSVAEGLAPSRETRSLAVQLGLIASGG
jgi:DNA-binding SARP family transcriptional activator